MPRKMNLAAVKAAIASPRTPAPLKKGLIKKFGHLLGKISMSALATTVRANPKKKTKRNVPYGYGKEYNNPGGFKYRSDYELDQRKLIDIYVTKMKDGYYIDYPHKHYTGKVKTKKQLDAFLKPAKAMGLKISYV